MAPKRVGGSDAPRNTAAGRAPAERRQNAGGASVGAGGRRRGGISSSRGTASRVQVISRSSSALLRRSPLQSTVTEDNGGDYNRSWRPSLPVSPLLESVLDSVERLCKVPAPVPTRVAPTRAVRGAAPATSSTRAQSARGSRDAGREQSANDSFARTGKVKSFYSESAPQSRAWGSASAAAPPHSSKTPTPQVEEAAASRRIWRAGAAARASPQLQPPDVMASVASAAAPQAAIATVPRRKWTTARARNQHGHGSAGEMIAGDCGTLSADAGAEAATKTIATSSAGVQTPPLAEVDALPQVNEDEIYSKFSKLYCFVGNDWVDKGTGEAKLLKHKETGQVRFVLWQEKTMKVLCNHLVVDVPPYCELLPSANEDRCWVWTAQDFADDEMKVERLTLRFSTSEQASDFKTAFEHAKQLNKKAPATSADPHPFVAPPGGISAATWNISAVNNNPFEYWISHDDSSYAELMLGVEEWIEAPGEFDVPIGEVFREEWFLELKELMEAQCWCGIDVVEELWKEDYKDRKIVSGFLRDKSIGSKRLVSMPDRILNQISVLDSSTPVYRPTVINNYSGPLASLDEWWPAWKRFLFVDSLQVDVKGEEKTLLPCEMLTKINRSKYPALSEAEENASIPLQTLCQAIFDAVMVHFMVTLSPDGHWQNIKKSIVDNIYSKKDESTLSILRSSCVGVDVICLQECAAAFLDNLLEAFGHEFHVVAPREMDPTRDQNSMLLLRKETFPDGVQSEVTDDVVNMLPEKSRLASGDLCAVIATHQTGFPVLIASFHGDSNGLLTLPLICAVVHVLSTMPLETKLVCGMDANTYLARTEGLQNVSDFLEYCQSLGLRTCWPDGANLEDCCTTCNARTYLQPQLNKSVRSMDKLTKGDVNPKDHILVQGDAFDVMTCIKDNTGERRYIEKECFPSLQFPSDHGLVVAVFKPRSSTELLENQPGPQPDLTKGEEESLTMSGAEVLEGVDAPPDQHEHNHTAEEDDRRWTCPEEEEHEGQNTVAEDTAVTDDMEAEVHQESDTRDKDPAKHRQDEEVGEKEAPEVDHEESEGKVDQASGEHAETTEVDAEESDSPEKCEDQEGNGINDDTASHQDVKEQSIEKLAEPIHGANIDGHPVEDEVEKQTGEDEVEKQTGQDQSHTDEHDADQSEYVVVCSGCGVARLSELDLLGFGLDFRCEVIGSKCGDRAPADVDDGGDKLEVQDIAQDNHVERSPTRLNVEESRLLFETYAMQIQELSARARHNSEDDSSPQARCPDNVVISHRGERFVK